MTSKRGDIVLVMFPDSNSLTAKRRPAIVVQADGLPTLLSQVIVAMTAATWPLHVQIRYDHPQGKQHAQCLQAALTR